MSWRCFIIIINKGLRGQCLVPEGLKREREVDAGVDGSAGPDDNSTLTQHNRLIDVRFIYTFYCPAVLSVLASRYHMLCGQRDDSHQSNRRLMVSFTSWYCSQMFPAYFCCCFITVA